MRWRERFRLGQSHHPPTPLPEIPDRHRTARRTRLLHFLYAVNTPQNVVEAAHAPRQFHGPRWSAAEGAEWREMRR
jgi:hypothetical protein